MYKFYYVLLIALLLTGCISFQGKEVYLTERTADKLYFHLTLPTGNRFLNPHGLVGSKEIQWYTVISDRKDSDFTTTKFKIKAQQVPIKFTHGTIKVKYLESSCILVINIIPENDDNLILNGTHHVDKCSKI